MWIYIYRSAHEYKCITSDLFMLRTKMSYTQSILDMSPADGHHPIVGITLNYFEDSICGSLENHCEADDRNNLYYM